MDVIRNRLLATRGLAADTSGVTLQVIEAIRLIRQEQAALPPLPALNPPATASEIRRCRFSYGQQDFSVEMASEMGRRIAVAKEAVSRLEKSAPRFKATDILTAGLLLSARISGHAENVAVARNRLAEDSVSCAPGGSVYNSVLAAKVEPAEVRRAAIAEREDRKELASGLADALTSSRNVEGTDWIVSASSSPADVAKALAEQSPDLAALSRMRVMLEALARTSMPDSGGGAPAGAPPGADDGGNSAGGPVMQHKIPLSPESAPPLKTRGVQVAIREQAIRMLTSTEHVGEPLRRAEFLRLRLAAEKSVRDLASVPSPQVASAMSVIRSAGKAASEMLADLVGAAVSGREIPAARAERTEADRAAFYASLQRGPAPVPSPGMRR